MLQMLQNLLPLIPHRRQFIWSHKAYKLRIFVSLQEMLQAGLIVAGYDARDGGQVYGLPLGGTLVKVPFAIGVLLAHQLKMLQMLANPLALLLTL